METMEVIIDGQKRIRAIESVDVSNGLGMPVLVPVLYSNEACMYSITGEAHIIKTKSKPWNKLP